MKQAFIKCGLVAAVVVLLARRGAADEPATEPATQAATQQGPVNTIAGVIRSATPITKIVAVDRTWGDPEKITKQEADENIHPGTWDGKTGEFTIGHLLAGRTYDIIVWNGLGRWEGVNMDYHRPITPDTPLDAEDRAWIENFINNTPQFYDKHRVLWMAADHRHATVLVELERTTEFVYGKSGDVIYRAELWYFENLFGGWAKDRNTEKVMVRWRGEGAKFPKVWQFVPQLGGIQLSADGKAPRVEFTLPEKADAKRGVAAGL
jgi:hypothetical protein